VSVDYEAQYNNRARVPDHPQIMAGWARDAAAYRAEHPPVVLPYGPGERQAVDLFPGRGEGAVLFIHGGYWQALERGAFSHLARGANAHGVTFGLVGYDLCPAVRIADIVDQVRTACATLWRRDRRRLVVAGHSAGGHLAACMLATDWKALDPDLPADLVPAAYAVSGIFELRPLLGTSVNQALGLDEAEADRSSPLLWPPPAGLSLDAVVGADESEEYLRQSRAIVTRWGAAAVATRYEAVAGANHFTVIAPLSDPDSAMTRRLVGLARGESDPSRRY
jgi:arylformamidase